MARKTLNKNLVIGLSSLGFAIVMVAGVVMVKSLQKKDPVEFVRQADQLVEEEKWKEAGQYFRRAYQASLMQDEPKPEYLVRQADMLNQTGQELRAMQVYREAVLVDPGLLAAQERLLEINLEIARMQPFSTEAWQNVRETADAILDLEGQEQHARSMYGRGLALLGLKEQAAGNEADGVANLESAADLAPKDVDIVRELSRYYFNNDEQDRAKSLIRELVERSNAPGRDAARSRCLYAGQLRQTGDYEGALRVLEDARRLAGDDPVEIANVAVRTGEFYRQRWLLSDTDVDVGVELAAIPERNELFDKAVSHFGDAIEAAEEEYEAYVYLAEMYRSVKEVDEAIKVLDKRLQLPFNREGLRAFQTRANRYTLLLGLSELNTVKTELAGPGTDEQIELAELADDYIEQALGEVPNGVQALHQRGKLRFVQGRHRDAITWFEEADANSRVGDWRNLRFLALARLETGQLGAAREAITRAVERPNAPAACWTVYARVLLMLEEPEQAVMAANQALALNPADVQAQFYKAAAQKMLGQDELATEIMRGIATDQPRLIAVQAATMRQEGLVKEAEAKLLAALEQNPTAPELIKSLAMLYQDEGRKPDAVTLVRAALAADPENFELKLMNIQLADASEEERWERYNALVSEIDDDYTRAVRLLAYYERQDDVAKQLEQLGVAKDLIKANATPAARKAGEQALRTLIDRMFELCRQGRNFALLDELVAEATELNLDAADGMSYEGRRLMVQGYAAEDKAAEAEQAERNEEAEQLRTQAQAHFDGAIEALRGALEKYPSSGQTWAELGQAFVQVNQIEEARTAFERANELTPRDGRVLKRLALLSRQLGDMDGYEGWLAECGTVIPEDSWVVQRQLEREEEENPREGIARREEIRARDPENLENVERLARLYQLVGDFEKAEQRINDLINSPQAEENTKLIGYCAQMLRSIDRAQRSLKLLEDYVMTAPPEQAAEAQLLVGDHYASQRMIGNADAAYLAAADIEANYKICFAVARHFLKTERPTVANEWIEKAHADAVSSDAPVREEIELVWMDTLIRIGKTERARELCDAFLSRNEKSAKGLFMDAQVAMVRGRVDESLGKLDQLLELYPAYAAGLFARAQLLATMGQWQRSVQDLEELRTLYPKALNYAPRLLLTHGYTKLGRDDAAFRELETIHNSDPDARVVAGRLIDMYISEDRYPEADRVLTTLLSRTPNDITWLVKSAEVAVAQGDRSKSLANFKQAARLSGYAPAVTVRLLDACRKKNLNVVDQGINYYENDIPADRRAPQVLMAYATLIAERGDLETAVELFSIALHRSEYRSFEFLNDIGGIIHTSFGQAKAMKMFSEEPSDELFIRPHRHILAMIRQATGDLDGARESLRELRENAGSNSERVMIMLREALVEEAGGNFDGARASYEAVLAINDRNLAALNNLAYLLTERLDLADEAIPYARRAVAISNQPAVIDTLGWSLLKAGQLEDAVAQLAVGRQEDVTNVPINYHLAEAYRRLGQFEHARRIFQEVLETPRGSPNDEYLDKAQAGLSKAEAQNKG